MTSDMAFECLLVSGDPVVICVMNKLLDKLSICTKLCSSPSKAFDNLLENGADLIILDWQDGSEDLLGRIRRSGRWQKPTIVAVSELDSPVHGAHVVVRKPLTDQSGATSLKAAYSRMVYDYRRHARHPLMKVVNATDRNNRSVNLTVTDIGDGGVGICSKEKFAIGDIWSFRLELPGAERAIYIEARVQWTRTYGAAGCEFLLIPPVDLTILHGWLKNTNQIKKPLADL